MKKPFLLLFKLLRFRSAIRGPHTVSALTNKSAQCLTASCLIHERLRKPSRNFSANIDIPGFPYGSYDRDRATRESGLSAADDRK